MVCRDRNHPSVIMWSTGNEVHEQYEPAKGIARHLAEVVHRFDHTRPVTFGASYPSKSAMNGTELQVDVHGAKEKITIRLKPIRFISVQPPYAKCIRPVYAQIITIGTNCIAYLNKKKRRSYAEISYHTIK